MSRASHKSGDLIKSYKDLAGWLHDGATPKDQLQVGSEHEKIIFNAASKKAALFRGKDGLEQVLSKLQADGWSPVLEDGHLIELTRKGSVISLEPAGQLELATPAMKDCHAIADEVDTHIDELINVLDDLDLDAMGLGYHPIQNFTNLPRVPKGRYKNFHEFMKDTDPKTRNALKMMYGTSSTQANLGFENEEDMVKKLRVSIALQPVVTALFANSPFANGRLNGYQSNRSRLSHNAADGRYGFMLPVAFEEGFGFERFAEFALKDMPLIGVYKDDTFKRIRQQNFEKFIAGTLPEMPGEKATLDDWNNHLNCIWPEVRVRQFLEMRGADNGPVEMVKALPALWVGLLYDPDALDAAYDLIKDWTEAEREALRTETPVNGLRTKFRGMTVQDVAKEVLKLSEHGLKNRNVRDKHGNTEAIYLEPLHEIAESGLNWADRLTRKYHKDWGRDVRKVFNEMSYKRAPSVLKDNSFIPAPQNRRRKKL